VYCSSEGQSCKWHAQVKTSGLKMVNECSCGPRLSACVLFTKGQKSLEYDFHEGGTRSR
jgi:hypothetical protein